MTMFFFVSSEELFIFVIGSVGHVVSTIKFPYIYFLHYYIVGKCK